jgi:hypothetical protein
MRMRSEAIQLLIELYDAARSEADKRKAKLAMFEATRFPSYGSATNDLLVCILQNSAVIADFFASRAATEAYEILQTLESSFLLLYRWNGGFVGATLVDPIIDGSRADLIQGILKFRDAANANKSFVVYKILVGYESVFPPAWEDEDFDWGRKEEYRTRRIDEFVAEVNDTSADEWLAIIERCAETRSDDMATFPSFCLFLQKLGAAKPTVVFGYLDRMSERLSGFLGVMLSGLAESDRQDELAIRISRWIYEERHLAALAHYMQFARRFDPSLLATLARLGIKKNDNDVVVNVMSTLARRYADAPDGLIETVFLPTLNISRDAATHGG